LPKWGRPLTAERDGLKSEIYRRHHNNRKSFAGLTCLNSHLPAMTQDAASIA